MAKSAALKKVPSFVTRLNPIVNRMLGIGFPMGPNGLITVRGRTSGEPRTTPVAFVDIDGRTWVQSPFGDVNWVRNLRAAGEATITVGKRSEEVRAVELSKVEKVDFYREVLGPYVRRMRGGRFLARFLGMSEILNDPIAAADAHPVFELRRETAGA
jgi:deazaflavin-dependent oxidoreductase (nitroreductase family)